MIKIKKKIGNFFATGSNRNFDGLRFLVGSSLVGAKGFLKSQGAYLESDFGTSTPNHIKWSNQNNVFTLVLLHDVSFQKAMQKPFPTTKYGSSKWIHCCGLEAYKTIRCYADKYHYKSPDRHGER